MNKCPYCGFENEEGGKFCAQCGSSIGSEKSQTSALPPQSNQEEPDSNPNDLPDQMPKVKDSRKKQGARGIIISLVLAIVCFGIGAAINYMNSATEMSVVLEVSHDNHSFAQAVCFKEDGFTGIGSLFLNGPQGEQTLIDGKARKGTWQYEPEAETVIYLNSENALCIRKISEEASVVLQENAETGFFVTEGLLCYRKDGQTQVYDLLGAQNVMTIDGNIAQGYFERETNIFYYINEDNALISAKEFQSPIRLKGDVSEFQVLENETVICGTGSGKSWLLCNGDEYSFNGTISKADADPNWPAYYFLLMEEENRNGKLLLYVPGLEPVTLEKNIDGLSGYLGYARAGRVLYYFKNGAVYYTEIPEFSEKNMKNQESLDNITLGNGEKLGSNVDWTHIKISQNQENLAWINQNQELWFYSHPSGGLEEGETSQAPVMVEKEAVNLWVFDSALIYQTLKGEIKRLPVTPGASADEVDIKLSVTLYAPKEQLDGEDEPYELPKVVCSLYGDYVAVADMDTGILQTFREDNKAITLVPHMEEYTDILVAGRHVWEEKLELEDFAGNYGINEISDLSEMLMDVSQERILIKINSEESTLEGIDVLTDKALASYEFTWSEYGDNQLELYLVSVNGYDTYGSMNLEIRKDGQVIWTDDNLVEYILEPLTEGQIEHRRRVGAWKEETRNSKDERDKIIKDKRELKKKEELKEKLDEKGRSYYRNGVYLSAGSKLYDRPNKYSSSGTTTAKSETWTVHSYRADSDDNIVWLELHGTSGTYWVYK